MTNELETLLASARERYEVQEAITVEAASELLESFGAVPLTFNKYKSSLVDEFMNPDLIVRAYTIHDAVLLAGRATEEEREVFMEDQDEDFDPLEYGAEQAEWSTFAHEVEVLFLAGSARGHVTNRRTKS